MSDSPRPEPVTDLYLVDELLSESERDIRDRVRAFGEREVLPVANDYWERAEFPAELVRPLAELGVCGGVIRGYGCPGMSEVAAGLVNLELARADGSVGRFFGVQSNLVMQSIALLGSEEQRERWLPSLARLELIGAFGLTEPEHGSDAVALETSAQREGDGFVLDGAKRWIGNASFADVTIVWARGEDGEVGGYLVEKGETGFSAQPIAGKTSQRSVIQAEIRLDGVRVPDDARLPGCRGFADVARVLTITRTTIAWRALGHALAGYELARAHVMRREQFGRPLAGFQLVQDKLSRMLAEITCMQLLCLRLSQLTAAGKLTPGIASLAKLNNAAKARRIVADARDLLGGDGILLERHVARHHADIEALYTFEGTDSVQSLIVGREITGLSALSGR
jgi:glutaryl-CoA dehydrogenase